MITLPLTTGGVVSRAEGVGEAVVEGTGVARSWPWKSTMLEGAKLRDGSKLQRSDLMKVGDAGAIGCGCWSVVVAVESVVEGNGGG